MFKEIRLHIFFLYSYIMKAQSILQLYLKESYVHDIFFFSQSRLEREWRASTI